MGGRGRGPALSTAGARCVRGPTDPAVGATGHADRRGRAGAAQLSARLLAECGGADTWLVDSSVHMHALSAERLAAHNSRVHHVSADFSTPEWTATVPTGVDALVTLQAVHELRDAARIPALYEQFAEVLRPGGTVLVADRVNGDHGHEDHYLTTDEHQRALEAAGFRDATVELDLGFLALVAACAR